MTIAGKFTLALSCFIVAAVAVVATVEVRDELGRTESDIVEYETSTAHALRPAIRDVWLHDGEGRALEVIQEEQQRLGNLDIRWVSLDPRAPAAKRPRVDLSALGALVGGGDVVVVDHRYQGVGRIFTYVRLNVGGPSLVAMEVSRSLVGHGQVRRSVVRNAALTGLAVAVVSALVTTLLGMALIGRPLSALVTQARRVGEGDLSHRIGTRRHDEISAVAREMNRMCDRLSELQRSERAQADAKTQALAQLRHADRLATVGRLAAGLAHELGTPLNVVLARAKQLTSGEVPEKARDKARIIVEQVERMTRLIRQLLDFARKRELKPTEVELHGLVNNAMTLLDPIARTRSVSLEVTGGLEPIPCQVDAEQMVQVVLNLAMNAVHASAPGQAVTIVVGRGAAMPPAEDGRAEQACARIEVRDRGTGISSDALPRIFEPFYTTKDVGEGTGLGLSVAYGIVKDHGGWVDVVSHPGEGSVFTVWLPERGRA